MDAHPTRFTRIADELAIALAHAILISSRGNSSCGSYRQPLRKSSALRHVSFRAAHATSVILLVALLWASRGTAAVFTVETVGVSTKSTAAPVPRSGLLSAAAWEPQVSASVGRRVLTLALDAARCAVSRGVASPPTLTIIDYSRPSLEPRLWVLDLVRGALAYEELVAHGQGSGGNVATSFSNTPNSHQSSIGLFQTDTTYVGRNGYSLRLDGLERGFNDRARERAIVMHGAPYVNDLIGRSLGRLGRSHGCPAVRDAIARELIDRVKGGGLLFAYYPDANWLARSVFLNGCSAAPRTTD
jgi:hypothetical protein